MPGTCLVGGALADQFADTASERASSPAGNTAHSGRHPGANNRDRFLVPRCQGVGVHTSVAASAQTDLLMRPDIRWLLINCRVGLSSAAAGSWLRSVTRRARTV